MQKWKLKINPEEVTINEHNVSWWNHSKISRNIDNKITWVQAITERANLPRTKIIHTYNKWQQIKNKYKALYKTYIKSIITYGHQVWAAAAKSHTNKVQKIHNKFLRIFSSKLYYRSIVGFHEIAKMPIYHNPQLHLRI